MGDDKGGRPPLVSPCETMPKRNTDQNVFPAFFVHALLLISWQLLRVKDINFLS